MPNIPVIAPYVTTPQGPANIRSGNISAPLWAGVTNAGRDVADLGAQDTEFGLRLRSARDAASLVEADAKTGAAQVQMKDWMAHHPDAKDADVNAQRDLVLQQTKDDIATNNPMLTRQGQDHLDGLTTSWDTRFTADVKWQRTAQAIQQSREQMLLGVNRAVMEGNPTLLDHTLEIAGGTNLFKKDELEMIGAGARNKLDMGSVANQMNKDPFVLTEKNLLTYEHLNDVQRRELLYEANKAQKTVTEKFRVTLQDIAARGAGALSSALNDGTPIGDYAGRSLMQQAQYVGVPLTWLNSLEKQTSKPAYDPVAFDKLRNQISFTPTAYFQPNHPSNSSLEARTAINDALLPKDERDKLFKVLEDRSNPDHVLNSPAGKQAREYIKSLYDAKKQFFTKKDETGQDKVYDFKAWQKSQTMMANLNRGLDEHLMNAKGEPDAAEVWDYITKQAQPYLADTAISAALGGR